MSYSVHVIIIGCLITKQLNKIPTSCFWLNVFRLKKLNKRNNDIGLVRGGTHCYPSSPSSPVRAVTSLSFPYPLTFPPFPFSVIHPSPPLPPLFFSFLSLSSFPLLPGPPLEVQLGGLWEHWTGLVVIHCHRLLQHTAYATAVHLISPYKVESVLSCSKQSAPLTLKAHKVAQS